MFSVAGPRGAVIRTSLQIDADPPPHQLFFPVRADGRYAIPFDNRHSPFTDKTVVLEWWDERRGPQRALAGDLLPERGVSFSS